MRKMELSSETPMIFVLEAFPQTFPLFRQIGVCCICEDNMNSTVGELCAAQKADVASFLETLRAIIETP